MDALEETVKVREHQKEKLKRELGSARDMIKSLDGKIEKKNE